MKNPKRAENKRVLAGRTVLAGDGRLIALPAGTFMETPIGIGDHNNTFNDHNNTFNKRKQTC